MDPQVVSRSEWLAARKRLLAMEKDFTRQRDALNAERRRLPMTEVAKPYVFAGRDGPAGLLDLFEGRSQLLVYHFMFDPEWDEGCESCSFLADNIGHQAHLYARDTTLAMVSRAPLAKLEPFRQRMGWAVPWYSSFGSDFNYDFNVSFTPEQIAAGRAVYNYREGTRPMEEMSGRSIFYRDETGAIFHTYSSFARGGEVMLGAYALLDMTPKGRNEKSNLTDWVRLHDRYEAGGPEGGER
jgi:predicted dithiol-disulfide oxidoreductase (DUF899 family)